jgi:LPXTG-site transpeptidase (sortase) family protein
VGGVVGGAGTDAPAARPSTRQAQAGSVAAPVVDRPPAGSSYGLRPSTVVVPALGVRAAVDPIDVVDGALTPPTDPRRVGWWAGGARPGAPRGTAVVTGHTVADGGGAFDRLDALAPGADVVVTSGGRDVRYAVVSVRVLDRAALARRHRSVFRQDGPGRLVLVTCEDWDGTAYRSNVVVVARPR